jgi:hypothetical protein
VGGGRKREEARGGGGRGSEANVKGLHLAFSKATRETFWEVRGWRVEGGEWRRVEEGGGG